MKTRKPLTRRKPLRSRSALRSAPPKQRKPIRRRNVKRRASEFKRCYHSRERVEFVHSLPCICFGKRGKEYGVVCSGATENAHIVTGGTGRKAGYETIVPLCFIHHREMHGIGPAFVESEYGVSLEGQAIHTQRQWELFAAHALTGET